ncbi:uncharacterized protein LOC123551208 [Mercenaria mercenaria]|uniref:uncharacterized protein LOC123551208 n=1 Tax=Mercenaria mercenaria TaxID=6596 RepID=UPI00234E9DBE|nr:uncharacterized protein LOC123551208 [Mercenaria mercenaria]
MKSAMRMSVHLFVSVSLFVSLTESLTYGAVSMNKYLSESVCWNDYGTVLRNFYKIRDKRACGTKCTENNECNSFLYNKNAGWCRINSDVFVNRTSTGCNRLVDYAEITTVHTIRHAKPPKHCGPVPSIPSIIVDNTSGNYSVGAQFPYSCTLCTSFPPLGSPGVLECDTDGRWVIPPVLCVHGADIGFLQDGSPIPVDAIGCGSVTNDTCYYSSLPSGLQYDGDIGNCYCDETCCGNGDCCYDTSCYQDPK